MKNLIIALLFCTSISLQAQKTIEKNIEYEGQPVEIELDFASSIEVVSWDKPTIQIIANISTEDEKYTALYALNVERNGSLINVSSNSKEIFKAYQKEQGKQGLSVLYTNALKHQFDYKLYLPKGIKVDISSITGNISSEFFQGNINADLVNGDISIRKFKGNLKLETVNGKIELPSENTSISAKTVTGKIHIDSKLNNFRKEKFIGEELELVAASTSNSLNLQTVSGDIFLK